MSLLSKEPAGSGTGALDGDGGVFSEASSDGELYLDSVTELDCGDGDFADLTAFLSVDEINLSLDLAREAFGDQCEREVPGPTNATTQEQALHHGRPQNTEHLQQQQQTINTPPDDGPAAAAEPAPISKPRQTPSESPLFSSSSSTATGKPGNHKSNQPVYKQDKPRLVHEGLELNERSASASEFCSRAATFIEELSSIFKSTPHLEQQEEDSSSPDSGYLSPRSRRPAPPGSVSAPTLPSQPEEAQHGQPAQEQLGAAVAAAAATRYHPPGAPTSAEPLSPPCFLQKLKSQEVAEGSPIRLECRVSGNPQPLVR